MIVPSALMGMTDYVYVAGVPSNPDSITAVLYRWVGSTRSASGVTVTCTAVGSGEYKFTWTNGAWDITDEIELVVLPVVSGVTYPTTIWRSHGDTNYTAISAAFSYAVVERSPDDDNPIFFEWPNNSDTLTVTRQLTSGGTTGSFGAATGAATFVRTRTDGVHMWKLAFNAADRPSVEGLAVYKIVGSVYTTMRELTLRVAVAGGSGSSGPTIDDIGARVNTEVLDVLTTDTFVELAAPPAATSSLKDKLTWLFMWSRNKSTETSSQRKLFADNTITVVSTEGVTDDGTKFTKGEAS